MKYRKLKRCDIEVSEIGFGAWAFSLPGWWGKKIDEDGAKRMLKRRMILVSIFLKLLICTDKEEQKKLLVKSLKI